MLLLEYPGRKGPLHRYTWALMAMLMGFCRVLHAEQASIQAQSLQRAEQAYAQVDFESTHREAQRALELGYANVAETTRLHVLLGISCAALNRVAEAKSHFVVALTLSPELRLDRSLSPKLRSPYLEARGLVESQSERLALRADAGTKPLAIDLHLSDPSKISRHVTLYVRETGTLTYAATEQVAAPLVHVTLRGRVKTGNLEYYASVSDEFGNILFSLGSATSPLSLRSVSHTRHREPALNRFEARRATSPSPQSWFPAALAGGGLTALGTGVYFNVLREQAAKKWNSSECERPGSTRIAQCADVNSDRRRDERLALVSYVAGGALLVSGALTWVLFDSETSERPAQSGVQLTCAVGPALFSALSCDGKF